MILQSILAGALGALLGVVTNILADSLPLDRKPHRPQCGACTAPRDWWAWSSITAGATGRWGCPYCGTPRRRRDLFVEILSIGGAIAILLWAESTLLFWSGIIIAFIYLLITVIDTEYRLILHIVSVPAMFVVFVLSALNPEIGYKRALIGGAIGLVTFLVLYLLGGVFAWWAARRRGEGMEEVALGFGDVTLATLIGLTVGFPGVIEALLRGIIFAGIFSIFYLLYMALRRKYSAYQAIPYGPFLVLGALYVYFFGWSMLKGILGMNG